MPQSGDLSSQVSLVRTMLCLTSVRYMRVVICKGCKWPSTIECQTSCLSVCFLFLLGLSARLVFENVLLCFQLLFCLPLPQPLAVLPPPYLLQHRLLFSLVACLLLLLFAHVANDTVLWFSPPPASILVNLASSTPHKINIVTLQLVLLQCVSVFSPLGLLVMLCNRKTWGALQEHDGYNYILIWGWRQNARLGEPECP